MLSSESVLDGRIGTNGASPAPSLMRAWTAPSRVPCSTSCDPVGLGWAEGTRLRPGVLGSTLRSKDLVLRSTLRSAVLILGSSQLVSCCVDFTGAKRGPPACSCLQVAP